MVDIKLVSVDDTTNSLSLSSSVPFPSTQTVLHIIQDSERFDHEIDTANYRNLS